MNLQSVDGIVSLIVSTKVRHLHKLPVAHRKTAGERFLATVKSHVDLQVVIATEAFITFRASIGLLAGVNFFVVLQNVLVAESFVARLTLEVLASR